MTYQTDNRRVRTFDILVDGQRIASQTLRPSSESRFFDVEYPLPAALVLDKRQGHRAVRSDRRQRDRRGLRRPDDSRERAPLDPWL